MEDYIVRMKQIMSNLDDKKKRGYDIQTFINLCEKVKDIADQDTKTLITETFQLLIQLSEDEAMKPKEYFKSFVKLKMEVKSKYGFRPKGAIQSEYIGFGVAIGLCFGAAFVFVNVAFIGIGIPIGIAIGAGIGSQKEQEELDKGNLY